MRARILIALASAAAIAGCQESGFDESRETARPLKVQHAMNPLTGTKVPGKAERPMTLSADTLGDTLALGVRPIRAALPGGRLPLYLRPEAEGVELVPPVSELDLAAIEAADPDLILGTKEGQGGLYEELSRIAPTVMSEGDGAAWKLNLRLHGEALGRTNDAEQLLIDYDRRAAAVADDLGKATKVSVVLATRNGLRWATPESFAGGVLADAGLELARDGEVMLLAVAPDANIALAQRMSGSFTPVDADTWWSGGGILAARAALADLAEAL